MKKIEDKLLVRDLNNMSLEEAFQDGIGKTIYLIFQDEITKAANKIDDKHRDKTLCLLLKKGRSYFVLGDDDYINEFHEKAIDNGYSTIIYNSQ